MKSEEVVRKGRKTRMAFRERAQVCEGARWMWESRKNQGDQRVESDWESDRKNLVLKAETR